MEEVITPCLSIRRESLRRVPNRVGVCFLFLSSMFLRNTNKTVKQKRLQKAFSIVEVVMSLFVLSIGFMGIMKMTTTTLSSSLLQRDSVIASMLVQEGIELVYNIRDTNIAQNNSDVFNGILPNISVGSSLVCKIYYSDSTLQQCGVSSGFALSANGNFYGSAGTPTKFSREIIVKNVDTVVGGVTVRAREITSVVVWGGSSWNGSPFPTTVDGTNCGKSTPNPTNPLLRNHCSFARTELQVN